MFIDAIGTCSSLGGAITSASAARAGISRAAELTNMNYQDQGVFGGETLGGPPEVVGHCAPTVPVGMTGCARTVELLLAATIDLASQIKDHRTIGKTGLCLVLPDFWLLDQFALEYPHLLRDASHTPSQIWHIEHSQLLAKLRTRLRSQGCFVLDAGISTEQVFTGGVSSAFKKAEELLENQYEQVLIAVVESRIEPMAVLAAATLSLLHTSDNPCGFFPGEAAVFIRLCRTEPTEPYLQVKSMGRSVDVPEHGDERPSGLKLAEVIAEACANQEPDWVLTGLNGTEVRSNDWGHALVRLARKQGCWREAIQTSHTVLAYGETGVVSPALALLTVLHAVRRKCYSGQRALIWGASESGLREAILLEVPL